MHRLTAAERRFYAEQRTTAKISSAIQDGDVQCDRCEDVAQTFAHAEGITDAICYACYPAFHKEKAAETRTAARANLVASGVQPWF